MALIVMTRRSFLAATTALAIPAWESRSKPKSPILINPPKAISVTLPPALFVAAHPDDETLAMGVTIAEHVAAGQDVHVLWLSRGEASNARNRINGTTSSTWWGVTHDPAAEGFSPLSVGQFGAARIAEGTNAVRCLGEVTIHEAGLSDGQMTQVQIETAIVDVADVIAPGDPVRLKTHTHTVDDHPDHLAAGAAALNLGDMQPGRFGDRRYYILSPYWSDPRLSQVNESWDLPASAEITARMVNACRSYGAWSPPHTYAIGHHSTPSLWPPLMTQPRCLFHV